MTTSMPLIMLEVSVKVSVKLLYFLCSPSKISCSIIFATNNSFFLVVCDKHNYSKHLLQILTTSLAVTYVKPIPCTHPLEYCDVYTMPMETHRPKPCFTVTALYLYRFFSNQLTSLAFFASWS